MSSDAVRRQVLEANDRFYAAIEALDIEAMREIWDTGSQAACVHPGGPWLHGWDQVRDAWEAIMANTGYIEFDIEVVACTVADPVAWVTCAEHIRTGGQGGSGSAEAAATNVFVLGPTGWKLLLHHASPVVRQTLVDGDD
ncbi:MAG: nuclear transport factor 2 family protein [Pseudonocardia sp.]|nr:nuclear transport factor 2 family protein [Pseudonocardia sp.]